MENFSKAPIVLFNASVILAGLKSPKGGSRKTLNFAKKGKIVGITSEVIFDEVQRHFNKLGLKSGEVIKELTKIFPKIIHAPKLLYVDNFKKVVIDEGDAHVLATAHESKADFLVTLDQKHLLILKDKIKIAKIVTPGELIEILSKRKIKRIIDR